VSGWEESVGASCIFTDVEVESFAVLVGWVAAALAAPFLITSNRTQIRHLDYDGVERAGESWRERILGSCEGEATPASISSSRPWSGTESELVDSGSESAC